MGRPERPFERDGSPAREVAFGLRRLRDQAGLTYDQLARRTNYGTSTLQEAAAGRRLPTLSVTLAIVAACGGDVEAWRAYWLGMRGAADSSVPIQAVLQIVPPWRAATDRTPLLAVTADAPKLVPESGASKRRRRVQKQLAALVAACAVLVVAVTLATSAILHDRHTDPMGRNSVPLSRAVSRSTRTYTEQEYNKHGAATFQFLNASGPGQPLEFQEFVQVSCKVRNTTLRSASPDGYWYRIASMPWNNSYYAVANTFLNGDPPNGPYTHNTDFAVPNCPKIHYSRG